MTKCAKCKKEIKSMQAYTVRIPLDKHGKEKPPEFLHYDCANKK